MPIIPKLNLKAAVRINDAALTSAELSRPTTSEPVTSQSVVQSFVVDESHDVKKYSPPSDEEYSLLADEDDFEYDEGERDFKSPPPSLLNPQLRVELTTEDGDSSRAPTDSPSPSETADVVTQGAAHVPSHVDQAEVSMQSFSDADSISEHSIQSDTSYTKEALQIMSSKLQGNIFPVLQDTESLSNAAAPVVPPSRKRRRAISKLDQDPTSLPLCDLLFYNPPPTIFQSKAQEDLTNNNNNNNNNIKETTPNKKGASAAKKRRTSRASSVASEASAKSRNEVIDVEDELIKSGDENTEKDIATNGDEPILTIDESGNIVIKNPSSLYDSKDKKPEAKMKSSTTYNSFRRRERSKNIWNTEETTTFYTALEIVGTDFSLMEAVFFKDRGRSRKQLKQKFKREEKMNRDCIDSILYKSLRNRSKLNDHLLQAAAGPEEVQGNNNNNNNNDIIDVPAVAGAESVTTTTTVLQGV